MNLTSQSSDTHCGLAGAFLQGEPCVRTQAPSIFGITLSALRLQACWFWGEGDGGDTLDLNFFTQECRTKHTGPAPVTCPRLMAKEYGKAQSHGPLRACCPSIKWDWPRAQQEARQKWVRVRRAHSSLKEDSTHWAQGEHSLSLPRIRLFSAFNLCPIPEFKGLLWHVQVAAERKQKVWEGSHPTDQ